MAHGPKLTGSAADFDGKLVTNLRDAKLVWVAEDPLPSGRAGGLSRGGFAMFPNMWKNIGFGGYAGPIIADNKVFVYVHSADEAAILADERVARDPYVRQGADPRILGVDYGMMRDAVFCFDALSGKKLWDFYGNTGKLGRVSKKGMASTPCYLNGKVYVRGMHGLYCFDAESGEKIWQHGQVTLDSESGQNKKREQKNKTFAVSIGPAPAEGSISAVGNTIIVMSRSNERVHTAGIDPESGAAKWIIENAGGGSVGLPGIINLNDKAHIVLPRSGFNMEKALKKARKQKGGKEKGGIVPVPETFLVVDPEDGSIVLESDALGHSGSQPLGAQGHRPQ